MYIDDNADMLMRYNILVWFRPETTNTLICRFLSAATNLGWFVAVK